VHPEFLEGCDNFQIVRYSMVTGVENSILVKSDSMKSVVGSGAVEWTRTENWLHFRNKDKVVTSCRKYAEDYPEFEKIIAAKGRKLVLPKELGEVVARAEVFSSDGMDENQVEVRLKPDNLIVKGSGIYGWFEERVAVKYDGDSVHFALSPKLLVELSRKGKLLVELSRKGSMCEVSENQLSVTAEKFKFATVTCAVAAKDDG